MRAVLLAVCLAVGWAVPAWADYIAVGRFEGQECTSYILIERCKMRSVDAVEGKNGRLYTLQKRYSDVSRHWRRKSGQEMCTINIRRGHVGIWGEVAHLLSGTPDFYTKKPDGGYEKVDVEYLIFPCRKVR